MSRTAGDAEEVAAVGFPEATVAVGDVGRNREACAVELINEEAVAALELLGVGVLVQRKWDKRLCLLR